MLQIVHDVAPAPSLFFATADGRSGRLREQHPGAARRGRQGHRRRRRSTSPSRCSRTASSLRRWTTWSASGVAYFSAAGNQARKAYEHAFVPGAFIAPGTFGARASWVAPPTTSVARRPCSGSSCPGRQRVHAGAAVGLAVLLGRWARAPRTTSTSTCSAERAGRVRGRCLRRPRTTWRPGIRSRSSAPSCAPPGPCVGFHHDRQPRGTESRAVQVRPLHGGSNRRRCRRRSTAGPIYGHANAQGAIAVGASNYKTPTTLEPFSSGGTTRILFDTDGNPLAAPDPRHSSRRSWPPTAPIRRSSAGTPTSTDSRTSSARRRRRRTRPAWRRCCCRRCRR